MTSPFLTDDAILASLGERLAHARLRRDLTQLELAAEAGVGKTTVERIEGGKSVTLANFVRVLRALDLVEELLRIVPEATLRPAELAQRSGRERRRASPKRRRPERPAPPTSFAWGDQQPAAPGSDR
ncbi:MAG: helix-turn-helix transcriptional regulator [Patulibacter sp.]|nr:helix-turn-helix transcriptional regulator [Patulibacter sp.]